MNNLEKKIVDALIDLKANHHVVSIKAEFETEGATSEEVINLKEIVTRAGLNLTVKIGGCGSIKDMRECKNIGVNAIVAPMIETHYALQKYIQSINSVFSYEEQKNINFLINIETITGVKNIDNIINSKYFSNINGIVLGRTDLINSMNLSKSDINSNKIYKIAKNISKKTEQTKKYMIVGGGISANSLSFLKKIPYLSKFETRKIVFDSSSLNNSNIEDGINKALQFELMWLENKLNLYQTINNNDINRINLLKDLINKSSYIL